MITLAIVYLGVALGVMAAILLNSEIRGAVDEWSAEEGPVRVAAHLTVVAMFWPVLVFVLIEESPG